MLAVVVDGLDVFVGTLISVAMAGLGAAVVAFVGSLVARSALLIASIAWATGGVFMFGAYLVMSGVPERADLVALEPRVVYDAYVDRSIDGDVLRLCDALSRCVTVSPRKGYYLDLVSAINTSQSYRVMYARKRALFADDGKLHTVIYDVSVNGRTLESFEKRVNQLKLTCAGAFVFGLVMFGGGFFVPRRVAPELAAPSTY